MSRLTERGIQDLADFKMIRYRENQHALLCTYRYLLLGRDSGQHRKRDRNILSGTIGNIMQVSWTALETCEFEQFFLAQGDGWEDRSSWLDTFS